MSTCWGHTYFLRIETKERNAFCLTNVTNKIKSYSVRRCGISGWALIDGGGLNFGGGGVVFGTVVVLQGITWLSLRNSCRFEFWNIRAELDIKFGL